MLFSLTSNACKVVARSHHVFPMLSRNWTTSKPVVVGYIQHQSRSVQSLATKPDEETKVVIKEGPERDLVNFPRRMRQIYPGKVRLSFIPEEWFEFFYKKTGVTGPYLFGTGLITFLVSKEIYVLEHEFYNGVALAIFVYLLAKKVGPQLAGFLDKENDALEQSWKDFRSNSIENLNNSIAAEEKAQWQAQGQKILFDAKKENVQFQLEANYRQRLMNVYEEVKKRLDFQVELQNASRRIEQQHMVSWIVDNVIRSISAQQEKEALQHCIANLKALAAKA